MSLNVVLDNLSQRCYPVCGHEGSSHISPVLALRMCIAVQEQYNSTLTTRQSIAEFYFVAHSHGFRYGISQNKNPDLFRIKLTTSALLILGIYARLPLDHSGDKETITNPAACGLLDRENRKKETKKPWSVPYKRS